MYTEGLRQAANISIPLVGGPKSHVHHLYVIEHRERDLLRRFLLARGIETMVHYPFLLHRQPLFKRIAQIALPVAERVVENILSLPLYPQLKDEEARAAIEAVLSYKSQT